jgi:predicted nuclease of predicted toxin-antitoxin system
MLLDANLSYRLVKKLNDVFPDCLHVTKTGLPVPAKDVDIWLWAQSNNYDIIVSNDEDFLHILERFGTPPKLVLLKTGNQSTLDLAEILTEFAEDMESLVSVPDLDLLEIINTKRGGSSGTV